MIQCNAALNESGINSSVYRFKPYTETETLHIHNCPLCHGHHAYCVKVSRISIIHEGSRAELAKRINRASLVRFFLCPDVTKTFRVTLTLFHTPTELIKDIEVIGLRKSRKIAL